MFSYRHGFHAGNHADVLKHIVLLECLTYLMQKDIGLMLVDTHAGAGIYQLNEGYATISQESSAGIKRLIEFSKVRLKHPELPHLSPAISTYLKKIRIFNKGQTEENIYPGSPALMSQMLRPQDKLRLFELHPTDLPLLQSNVDALHVGRQAQVHGNDGFAGLKGFLPPPTRRGFVLIDPSYEDKADYQKVVDCLSDSLKRFATGVYAIWYPCLERSDSQNLPDELKALQIQGKPISWLHIVLRTHEMTEGSGLSASGMFVINPPWKLKESMDETLPLLLEALGQDAYANFEIESSETNSD